VNKASSGSSVTLEGVSKKFGYVIALHPVDVSVVATLVMAISLPLAWLAQRLSDGAESLAGR